MSQPNDTIPDVHDTRIGRQSRRTILRALAATGSAAALGGVASAQDEEDADEEETEAADFDDVPVAGEFPEGETVGLQLVAENLPAPTDLDYVEVDGEIYHFIVTQTGQVFATNFDDVPDDIDDEDELAEEEEIEEDEDDELEDDEDELAEEEEIEADEDDEDVVEPEEESLVQEEDEPEEPVDVDDEDDPDDPEPDEEIAEDADEEAEPEPDEEVEDDPAEPQEFVFNGVIPAWFGMEPSEIDGEENPTLELTAGETYQFTWENGDGQPHNVIILDANDDILERTEIVQEAGESQTLEFEAIEEMDRYLCEVHPGTMVGSIQVEPAEEEEEEVEEADSMTPADMDLFLDIEDQLVSLGIGQLGGYDERGLLGLAFHPEFEENQLFYVHYSAPERHGLGYNHTAVVAEFQAEEDLTGVDPDSERVVMEIPQPQDNHNGGRLAFGPDGYLYVSLGDGGNVHDIGIGHVEDWYDENEGGNGQDTEENPHGGIHRIDVDADDDQEYGEYGIPEDNPLVDSDEDIGSYWAWGFRNPWGMSIDDDGQVFVSDAGQHAIESVYAVEAGGNYSWNVKEGSFCFSPDSPLEAPAECPDEVPEDADVSDARDGEPLLDPIAEYQHTRVSEAFIDSSVVVGGHRYAGEAIPELEGNFVFGNWSSQGVAAADGEVLVAVDPNGDDEMDDEDEEEDVEDDADLDEEDEATEETEEESWIQDDDEEELDEDEAEEEELEAEEEELEDDEDEDELVEDDERWELEELQFEGADDESLNRYVYGVERDENGELYILANTDFRPDPETGEIYRIVPAEEGEEIPEPEDPFVVDEEEVEDEDPEEEAPDDLDEEDEEFPEDEDEDADVPDEPEDEVPDDDAPTDPDDPDAEPEPEPQEADD